VKPVTDQDSKQPLNYAAQGRENRPLAAPRARGPVFRTMRRTFSVGFSIVLGAVAFIVITAALWRLHPGLGLVAGIGWFVFLPAIAGMRAEVRRRRAAIILTYLSQATTLNLPLARMIDAARWSESKKTGRRLKHLRDLLEDGVSLEVALPLATPEVSPRTVGLIAAGERLGRLPPALARVVEDHRAPVGGDPSRDSFARWYPLMMTTVVFSLVGLIMIFVMPKFEQIYADFGLRLPRATTLLLELSRGVYESVIIPILLALLFLYVIGSAFREALGGGDRFALLDQVLWRLPIIHGMQRDQGLGDAFHTIADGLRTGRSLPRAIDEAARLRVNRVLRTRLARWRAGIEEGLPADEAARRAGLPHLVGGMIASGRGGDPAAAVEFLANYYDGRMSRARELLRAAVVPAFALCFGALVLFLVTAMYQPILNLMNQLSASAMQVPR
jgi:type IV pilus assembly protein PilC